MALVKDGDIVLSEHIGFQDHDAEEPTTTQTTYLVASITKTFTAATLLAMEADGHLDLDARFSDSSDWDRRCKRHISSGIIFGGGRLDDGTVVETPRCDAPSACARCCGTACRVSRGPASSVTRSCSDACPTR